MLASVLFALVMMVILALLLARYAPRRVSATRLSPSVLRSLTLDLIREMGYEPAAWDENVLVATRKDSLGDSRFVVVLADADVDQAGVLAAAESVRSEGAVRGMLVSPGIIDTSGLAGLEVALTLVDGAQFRELIQRYLPSRVPEVERAAVTTPA